MPDYQVRLSDSCTSGRVEVALGGFFGAVCLADGGGDPQRLDALAERTAKVGRGAQAQAQAQARAGRGGAGRALLLLLLLLLLLRPLTRRPPSRRRPLPQVVCRGQGLGDYPLVSYSTQQTPYEGLPIWMDRLACTGGEESVAFCPHRSAPETATACTHLSVNCVPAGGCQSGGARSGTSGPSSTGGC